MGIRSGTHHSIAGRIGTLALGVASVAALAAVATSSSRLAAQQSPVSAGSVQQRPVWLDQNWSEEDRAGYHHASQGTATIPIPYAWFMALEQPDSRGLFSDPAYLDQFGFIPSPRSTENPGGLPIGFAVTPNAQDPRAVLGFTCAACHTGRIDYNGTNMLIDGGPALTNLGMFRNALGDAVKNTTLHQSKFDRFARRLFSGAAAQPFSAERIELREKMTTGVFKGLLAKLDLDGHGEGTVVEGFGRLDALNRIGNEVFGNQMGRDDNVRALTAPVAFPHIWDTSWFDWVQYNSSIEQPMIRNAGEAMGVGAKVNWDPAKGPLFTSTVPPDRLYAIESRLAGSKQPQDGNKFTGLRSPRWPERILPRIDESLAAQGAALYKDRCQGCHLPAPGTDEFWKGPHWTRAQDNPAGERYLALKVIPVSVVGTDEAQAADMKARTVKVAAAVGLSNPIGSSGRDRIYGFGPALGESVEKVVNRWYDDHGTSAADRGRMNGFRPNGIRALVAYKARPLNGIWATAPFLHNGSVPTLWALLSPYDERPKRFWLGNREFDPVNVGYRTENVQGAFELVAATVDRGGRVIPKRGNWNGGHLFDVATPSNRGAGIIGRPLSPAERRALVEYLKTL
ncbi:MAG TPA: di-heme-cytochrome C peroxidase [Allosphingosinicella sp.]